MTDPEGDDPLLDALLAGTPDRVLRALLPEAPAVTAGLRERRDALASMALALPRREPPAAVRARLEALVAQAPRRKRSALLVVDMIEDYLEPGRPLHVPRAREVVPALAARLARAREEKLPVLFLCDYHEPGDADLAHWPAHGLDATGGWRVVPELAPLPEEPVLKHGTFSSFVGTALEEKLSSLGVEHLVLTGCATEVGVLATATDALMRGYSVEVPADSQAGTSEEAERVALRVLQVLVPYGPAQAARQAALAR